MVSMPRCGCHGNPALYSSGLSLRKSSNSRNGSNSLVSPKPKARRRRTPAPSMVGCDSTMRLTGLIDILFSFYASAQATQSRHDRAVVVHRINAERLVLLGWSRAILLQMAHPLVAAGVADHSHFRAGPMMAVRRLRETIKSMLALSFGDAFEAGHVIAAIRAIHTRVRGQLRESTGPFPAGTRYSAEDPALLLWVHATLIDSVVLVYEQLVGPLSASERDQYLVEAADVAIALGAIDADLPRTWTALEAYLALEYGS